jgi:hypothetical protein
MQAKEVVHNLIILDESGSMSSIKNQIISGFNELVQTVKGVAGEYPEQEHYITFLSFNSSRITTHLYCKPVSQLAEINGERYRPDATTPLFDAMGTGINRLRDHLKDEEKTNVLVTILTDGMENASREYDLAAIKALVKEMEAKGWTFTYIGTDHDVEQFADSISIKNTLRFERDEKGLNEMFEQERLSRVRYSKRVRDKADTRLGYYDSDDD